MIRIDNYEPQAIEDHLCLVIVHTIRLIIQQDKALLQFLWVGRLSVMKDLCLLEVIVTPP